jgi:hypothetical protein
MSPKILLYSSVLPFSLLLFQGLMSIKLKTIVLNVREIAS